MEKKDFSIMFENLLHIGNKTNFWNPKMKTYIHSSINWIHVFNLVKTYEELEKVKELLKQYTIEWKKILFVATRLQARDAFVSLAKDTWNYYVTEKWVPWLLTNFKTIKKRIATYLKLLKEEEVSWFDMLTKKELAYKKLELEKLNKSFIWLKDMKTLPDIIFAVDGAYERQCLKEARTLKIKSLAILNTNSSPDSLEWFIPANTNSVKSLDFIAEELKKAILSVKVEKKVSSFVKINNTKMKDSLDLEENKKENIEEILSV